MAKKKPPPGYEWKLQRKRTKTLFDDLFAPEWWVGQVIGGSRKCPVCGRKKKG